MQPAAILAQTPLVLPPLGLSRILCNAEAPWPISSTPRLRHRSLSGEFNLAAAVGLVAPVGRRVFDLLVGQGDRFEVPYRAEGSDDPV